jgi:hypothetical protein
VQQVVPQIGKQPDQGVALGLVGNGCGLQLVRMQAPVLCGLGGLCGWLVLYDSRMVALLAGGAAGAELARAGSRSLRLGAAGSRRRAGNEHGAVSAAISTGNAGKTGALRKYGERRAGGLRISEKAGKSRKESRRRKSISGRRHLS